MKPSKKTLTIVFSCLFVCSYIYGQYTGPGSASAMKIYSVKEVKEQASQLDQNDTLVKLQGYIVEQINKDTYWFEDSTGRIWVEIDEDDLPKEPFDEKTELTIVGEVDHDLLEEVKVEVERILARKP
jgi:uncharacterized protein (TIGR00156 family)